ncbi:hypothetical protein BCIN_02g03730 [Botrytis cinerea B05.10]|uniref:Uncharacterized protein n=2 Tax=Botryotinia fuckeliana TaxID=40559 RepID=A0A384J9P8_BOTFB|nr:hypothetical protein BCIN_02g03730 [Botrytis cinerea B05.10]ATZ47044.1 hypothetical protein BCIN_02g03730 [Botrytis cinerea B05.10]CCD53160.1 hypothetical protein BofuT4_P121790.1 [Botrytis cinerea T4]
MSHNDRNNSSINPELSLEPSLEQSNVEDPTAEVEAANDNQVLNTNEGYGQIEVEAHDFGSVGGAFGNILGINLMDISEFMGNDDSILNMDPIRDSDSIFNMDPIRDTDSIFNNDFIMSSSDRNEVYEDKVTSQSEYVDEEYMDMRDSLRVTEDVAPLLLRSPSSPPSYSPPPTPVLKLLPMFTLSPGISSASEMPFFDDPTRYATRINARKVRMHDTRFTRAEETLRELPGIWWRRISKVPSSLRRCWTPYDIFDEYLENTLVAVNDYGAEADVGTQMDVRK